MRTHIILVSLAVLVSVVMATQRQQNKQPNIVFVLTDDQDVFLGGQKPIKKTKALIGDQGIIFDNMFVTSPLCCPSRSSIMTGNYVHNHNAINNSVSGNCSSPAWQQGPEKRAFATYLKQAGYNTFFAGKYLNQYGFPQTGGVEHIPPGWDWWTGLVGNSRYYDFSLSVNGTKEVHKHDYKEDYLTDIIHRKALDFLGLQHTESDPFLMMLSTPACHAPFTPAPQYQNAFPNETAPKTKSYNTYAKDKHWLLTKAINPMTKTETDTIEDIFKNRWRTLLSVDDMVEDVVNTLQQKGLLDNTYIIFSSDNGYHLGQFSLPNDKRQLYEFDIRVPLMVRGPGIKPGQIKKEPVLNIDFAPTFLDLAGVPIPGHMDGLSIKKVLMSPQPLGDDFRTNFMVEHSGEYERVVTGCPQWTNQMMGNCGIDCVCEDSKNNTYTCVRTLSSQQNLMYCEFEDSESFVEFYDLDKDPDQMMNLAAQVDPQILAQENVKLVKLSVCQGVMCNQVTSHPYPGQQERVSVYRSVKLRFREKARAMYQQLVNN